jgi:ankyrin repeat protein
VVQLLVAAGANIQTTDVQGRIPLHLAAANCYPRVVQMLAAAGADIQASDSQGRTPLQSAALFGQHEMAKLLLRMGANPQLRDALGRTALQAAAWAGSTDIVQLLLKSWGEPEVTAVDLVQAAKLAVRKGRMEALARLAKELQRLYPAELRQLFEGEHPVSATAAAAATLDAWASDVSSLDEQRAAVRRREEDVASEKAAVQQLIVGMAGVAKHAQQRHA